MRILSSIYVSDSFKKSFTLKLRDGNSIRAGYLVFSACGLIYNDLDIDPFYTEYLKFDELEYI